MQIYMRCFYDIFLFMFQVSYPFTIFCYWIFNLLGELKHNKMSYDQLYRTYLIMRKEVKKLLTKSPNFEKPKFRNLEISITSSARLIDFRLWEWILRPIRKRHLIVTSIQVKRTSMLRLAIKSYDLHWSIHWKEREKKRYHNVEGHDLGWNCIAACSDWRVTKD